MQHRIVQLQDLIGSKCNQLGGTRFLVALKHGRRKGTTGRLGQRPFRHLKRHGNHFFIGHKILVE